MTTDLTFQVLPEGGYKSGVLLMDGSHVLIQAKYVRRGRSGLHAEVTVSHITLEGATHLLEDHSFEDFGKSASRNTLTKASHEKLPVELREALPLQELQTALLVFRREVSKSLEQVKTEEMGDIPLNLEVAWDAHPLLMTGEPNTIFGDWGTGKSTLAMALACSMQTGEKIFQDWTPTAQQNVLYINWETGKGESRRRQQLIHPEASKMRHMEAFNSLDQMTDGLLHTIQEFGIGMVVVDSLLPALPFGNVDPAENAKAFYAALRRLQVTALIVAHNAKNADRPQSRTILGSVVHMMLARNIFEVKSSTEREGPLRVGLYHKKANNAPILKPFGVEIRHLPENITFKRFNLRDSPDLAKTLKEGVKDKIARLLKDGAMTVAALHESLPTEVGVSKVPENTIYRTLDRNKELFIEVTNILEPKVVKWGLRVREGVKDK